MQEVFSAILTKWNITAVSGGLHFMQAPQEQTAPFCVFTPVSQMPEDTFTEIGEQYLISFDLYDQDSSGHDARISLEGYLASLVALYDECTLTLSTYNHILMQRGQIRRMPDSMPGWWHYSVDYTIYVEKTGSR